MGSVYDQYDHSGFNKPGSYCWLEIPVLDLARARKFYSALFGWDFGAPSAMGLPDDGTYLIFSKKGTAAHGGLQLVKEKDMLVAPKDAGKQQWAVRITMSVVSVDETLRVAEEEGGEVLETKMPIGANMGNKGVLRDTEGNVFGVFESGSTHQDAAMEKGEKGR